MKLMWAKGTSDLIMFVVELFFIFVSHNIPTSLGFILITIFFFFFLYRMTIGLDALLFDVHFDGVFYFDPLRYENGVVYHFRVSKDKKFDYKGLCEHLEEKLETTFYSMFFKVRGCAFEVGLKIVESNSDLESMYAFCETYGKLDMFLAHIPQNLYDYYHTNLVCGEDVNEEASKLSILGIKKKDAGNMTDEELVSWAEEEAQKLVSPHRPRTVSRKHWDSVSPPKMRKTLNLENEHVASSEHVVDDTCLEEPVDVDIGSSEPFDHDIGTYEPVDHDTGPTVNLEEGVPRKFVHKGKAPMTHQDSPVHCRNPLGRNKGIVIEENVNPSVIADCSSDSETEIPDYSMLYEDSESEMSDRSVDYLSEGEEELIELRRRNYEAKRAPKVKNKLVYQQVGREVQSKRNGMVYVTMRLC